MDKNSEGEEKKKIIKKISFKRSPLARNILKKTSPSTPINKNVAKTGSTNTEKAKVPSRIGGTNKRFNTVNSTNTKSREKKGFVDFEDFKKSKEEAKAIGDKILRLEESKNNKPESERYSLEKGVQGGGDKYQDHKLAKELYKNIEGGGDKYQDHKLVKELDKNIEGGGDKYHDHKLTKGLDKSIQGGGAKYQDHKLGGGIKTGIQGGGAKYQDHKLGSGIKKRTEEDNVNKVVEEKNSIDSVKEKIEKVPKFRPGVVKKIPTQNTDTPKKTFPGSKRKIKFKLNFTKKKFQFQKELYAGFITKKSEFGYKY